MQHPLVPVGLCPPNRPAGRADGIVELYRLAGSQSSAVRGFRVLADLPNALAGPYEDSVSLIIPARGFVDVLELGDRAGKSRPHGLVGNQFGMHDCVVRILFPVPRITYGTESEQGLRDHLQCSAVFRVVSDEPVL